MEQTSTAIPEARRRGWPLFLPGVLLFLVGPGLYVAQVSSGQLWMPWYLPILATLGLVMMIAAIWRRPGIWRAIALVPFIAICGFEWYASLVATKVPVYAGPAQAGRKLPGFAAKLASGAAFTEQDLANGNPSVLVFFRGRW